MSLIYLLFVLGIVVDDLEIGGLFSMDLKLWFAVPLRVLAVAPAVEVSNDVYVFLVEEELAEVE